MHAAHPFLAVWDDHEVEDNRADGQPSSHQSDPSKTQLKNYPRRVTFAQRRVRTGTRRSSTTCRASRFKGDRNRIYEDYRLGSLVDLLLTDERQYRDRQPCNDVQLQPCADADSPRTMLGARQLEWFKSRAGRAPTTWKVWATELMVMATRLRPGRPGPGGRLGRLRLRAQADPRPHPRQQRPERGRDHRRHPHLLRRHRLHDRRPDDRARGDARVRRRLRDLDRPARVDRACPRAVLAALAVANPHIKFYDFVKRGYGVIEIGPTETVCELKTVDAKTRGSIDADDDREVPRAPRRPHPGADRLEPGAIFEWRFHRSATIC